MRLLGRRRPRLDAAEIRAAQRADARDMLSWVDETRGRPDALLSVGGRPVSREAAWAAARAVLAALDTPGARYDGEVCRYGDWYARIETGPLDRPVRELRLLGKFPG